MIKLYLAWSWCVHVLQACEDKKQGRKEQDFSFLIFCGEEAVVQENTSFISDVDHDFTFDSYNITVSELGPSLSF